MMGGWKQKRGWIQILPASCVPFTFPFLSQLSVCLIVSRVRAYLTTDQQTQQSTAYCVLFCLYRVSWKCLDFDIFLEDRQSCRKSYPGT